MAGGGAGAGVGPGAGPGNAAPDAGGAGGAPDGGTGNGAGGPYYCDAVKPILDSRCVSCHSSPPNYGAPSYMRLDVYGTTGAVQGAGALAPRIVARVTNGTMPPRSWAPPTETELSVLTAWLAAGAPECGPSSTGDAGVPPPPGQQDAGVVGVPDVVSFSLHVQPIFDAYCVSCHNHDYDQGRLELDPDRSYGDLLGGAECDPNRDRVERYDPRNSVLWLALSADPSSCAPPMPLYTDGLQALSPTDFAIVEKWISQGAPYN